MTNLLIVFCIALFASATFGVPLDKGQPRKLEEPVQNVCARMIYERLTYMMRKYADQVLQHVTDYDARSELQKFIRAGSEAVGKLYAKLDTIELVDDMELVPIDPKAPVDCPAKVLKELSRIESKLLAAFGVI